MSVIYRSLKNAQHEPGGRPRPRAAVSALEDGDNAPRLRAWAVVLGGVVLLGGAIAYGAKGVTPDSAPQVAEVKSALRVAEPDVATDAGGPAAPVAEMIPVRASVPEPVRVEARSVETGPAANPVDAPAAGKQDDDSKPVLTVGSRIVSGGTPLAVSRPLASTRVEVQPDELNPDEQNEEPSRSPAPATRPEPRPEPKVTVVNNRDEGQRLVGNLRAAMARRDREAVTELFGHLESLRGREDTFILKLKGFWHMSNGEQQEAEQALVRVLARLPDDLDANLNMALIESRSGRMNEAKYRAERLRARYPGDQRVQELGRLFR